MLIIDKHSFTLQRMCDSSIAIARELQNNLLNTITQRRLFLIHFLLLLLLVIPTTADGKKMAEMLERKLWKKVMRFLYHPMTLFDLILCNVFLALDFRGPVAH